MEAYDYKRPYLDEGTQAAYHESGRDNSTRTRQVNTKSVDHLFSAATKGK